MPKLIPLLAGLMAALIPVAAHAQGEGHQNASHQNASTSRQEPDAAKTSAPSTKRGISEEGGMKASGPSQAKGGESR